MVLALGFGIFKQRIFIKPFAVQENWRSNLDSVIEGKYANGLGWCVRKLRELTSKLRTGGTLDIFEKLAHDTVKKLNLIFGEFAGSKDKEIGHFS